MATYAPTSIAGTTGVFEHTIGFAYARTDDVKCYIDDVEIDRGSAADEWVYSSSGTKVKFTTPNEPQTGETLVIKRVTDISDAAIAFSAGSGFTDTDGNKALTQLLYAIDELQVPAFEYSSNVGSIDTAGVITTVPHNLGATPTRVAALLVNVSAELGYVTDDEVFIATEALKWDATNLEISGDILDILQIPHFDTAVDTAILPGRWTIVVRAWR